MMHINGENMLVLGITGGIGSGKSLVTKIMKKVFHSAVIDTDSIGHELLLRNGKAYKRVVAVFGKEILSEDGEINRKKLGEIVFSERKKLEELNSIVHPLVEEEVDSRIKEAEKKGYAFVCLETALLIEVGYDKKCDEIWFVYADTETRIRRLVKKRGLSVERVKAILEKQKSEEEFKKIAHRIINNSKNEKDTENQIREIVSSYRRSE